MAPLPPPTTSVGYPAATAAAATAEPTARADSDASEPKGGPVAPPVVSPAEKAVEKDEDAEAPPLVGPEVFGTLYPACEGSALLAVNAAVLNGWQPQKSPCCAGASLAGAVNAVRGLPRTSSDALTVKDGLEAVAEVVQHQLDQARSKLAYVGDVAGVEAAIEEQLRKEDIWDKRVPAKTIGRRLRALLRLEAAAEEVGAAEDEEPQPEEEEDAEPIAADFVPPEQTEEVSFANEDLPTLTTAVVKRHALHRLRKERPTTAEVGNWGIARGVPEGFACRMLLGKKLKGTGYEIPISASDPPETVARQWEQLVGAFQRPRTVILAHITNHYALFAAVRAYTRPGEHEAVREVLTARKGQQPRTWIPFEELRSICLSWTGYRLMLIQG